ncbi:MAG TPA: hypothetical protein VFZ14_03920 [Burkholderiales bacterium]|jgi:hypothetical protein|nr:hypothetical protein [Burkholderiales bacterium]
MTTPASLRRYAVLLYALSTAFVLRIAGQAIQRWAPVAFLPPFESFQGSDLPYALLLASQILILGVMVRYAWRLDCGALVPRHSAGMVLAVMGGAYFAGSLARIAIGLLVPEASSWFRAWISAAFHAVLALYVVILARYHVVESRPR